MGLEPPVRQAVYKGMMLYRMYISQIQDVACDQNQQDAAGIQHLFLMTDVVLLRKHNA